MNIKKYLIAILIAGSLLIPAASAQSGPSIYSVNTTADHDDGTCETLIAGDCTFREALSFADNGDEIDFQIPGNGPHTISLLSELSPIKNEIFINGTRFLPTGTTEPQIIIDGSNINGLANGLIVGADNVTIQHLTIGNFQGGGMLIKGDNALLSDNYLGIHPNGSPMPNGSANITIYGNDSMISYNKIGNVHGSGISLLNGAEGNSIIENEIGGGETAIFGNSMYGIYSKNGGVSYIGYNTIANNPAGGIFIEGEVNSGYSEIYGNNIGTNASGETAMPNGVGVQLVNANNIKIGFPGTGQGNNIAGNRVDGIQIDGDLSDDINIQNNLIGTDDKGIVAIPNGNNGIQINNAGSFWGVEILNNVISGNSGIGIQTMDTMTGVALIENNLIGTDLNGSYGIGNGKRGIAINGNQTSYAAIRGNTISANGGGGIRLWKDNVEVSANVIGMDATATNNIGNGNVGVTIESSNNTVTENTIADSNFIGLFLYNGATNNLIEGNTIKNNTAAGIAIAKNDPSIANEITRNSIYENYTGAWGFVGLGI